MTPCECTVYIFYICTTYSMQCTLYTAWNMSYIREHHSRYIQFNAQCISYITHRIVRRCIQYVVQCTLYSVRRIVYVVQCTTYAVRYIVYNDLGIIHPSVSQKQVSFLCANNTGLLVMLHNVTSRTVCQGNVIHVNIRKRQLRIHTQGRYLEGNRVAVNPGNRRRRLLQPRRITQWPVVAIHSCRLRHTVSSCQGNVHHTQ